MPPAGPTSTSPRGRCARRDLVRNGCEAIVRTAALGIAQACVLDPDDRLIALLVTAIEDAETLVDSERRSSQRTLREGALV